MQGWIGWFNSLHYTQPITDLATAKKYLTGTKEFHDTAVVAFLKSKTPELPPNLQPLRDSWNISDCDEIDFSKGNSRFDSLEMVDGKLQYAQSVYLDINDSNTVIATEAQADALKELDRLYDNLMALRPLLHPTPGLSWQIFEGKVNDLLSDFYYKKPIGGQHDGTLVRWKIPVIEALCEQGYGSKKKV
jgi:hypothetical protein